MRSFDSWYPEVSQEQAVKITGSSSLLQKHSHVSTILRIEEEEIMTL